MQIVYFPYLSMGNKDEIDFGFLKIWNFNLLGTRYVTDINLYSKVLKIMLTNHEHIGGALQGIGVVSIGESNFRVFSRQEYDLIREARQILFLCCLSQNNAVRNDINAGHEWVTTDNFDIRYQNFKVEDDNMALFDGYIVQSQALGYRTSRDRFYRPTYVPSPMHFSIDENLFKFLLQLKIESPRFFDRIIAASELFSESYFNSYSLSPNARILCQIGAFEMLLGLRKRDPRKNFKEKIETEVSLAGERKYVNYYETKQGKQKELLTVKGIWADKFYTLRNHIIHGEKIPKDDYIFRKNQHHIHIAMLFFIFFVKQEINKTFRRTIFSHRINWVKHRVGYDDKEKYIFIYESI